jgi:hypothetical protein
VKQFAFTLNRTVNLSLTSLFPQLRPRLERWFPTLFGLFVLHFFLVPDGNAHLHGFLAVIGLPLVLLFTRQDWLTLPRTPLFLGVKLYGAWFAASAAWTAGMDDLSRFTEGVSHALMLALFALAVLWLRREKNEALERGMPAFFLLVGGIAFASLALFYGKPWIQFSTHRIEALGELDHAIKAAAVYGLCGLACFARLLAPPDGHRISIRQWLLFGGMVLLPVALVVLTAQARGAMLGLAAGGLTLLLLTRHYRLLLALFTGAAAAGMALFLAFRSEIMSLLAARGGSYRMEAWQLYLHRLEKGEWLWGKGIADNARFEHLPGVIHPHSMFVSHLYYGGIIGLALFVLLLAVALWGGWKNYRQLRDPLPLSLLVTVAVMGLFDFSHLLAPPNAPWLYFWLPVLWAGSVTREPKHLP